MTPWEPDFDSNQDHSALGTAGPGIEKAALKAAFRNAMAWREIQAICDVGACDSRVWIASASRVARILATVSGSRSTRAIRDSALR